MAMEAEPVDMERRAPSSSRKQWPRHAASTFAGCISLGCVASPTVLFAFPGTDPLLSAAPSSGDSVRVGDLGLQMDQPGGGQGPTQGLTFVPSLGVQEIGTDNVNFTQNGKIADVVSSITPGILINANTQALQGNLNYSPNINLYAVTPYNDYYDQELNSSAKLTLIPETLFVNFSGYATQAVTQGGVAPGGVNVISSAYRSQIYDFSVAPTLTHEFGTFGVGEIGYALEYTAFSGNQGFVSGFGGNSLSPQSGSALPYFENGSMLTNDEHASFTTGSDFTRFKDKIFVDATQDSGFALIQGAYQDTAINELDYALTRDVTLIGTIGWEKIYYGSISPIHINDAVWGAGFRLTPNPDSTITVEYGHRDGFDSAYVNAVYALTMRTKFYANYSQTLSTELQAIQNNADSASVNASGAPIDSQTGAPISLSNQLMALEMGGVFRMTVGSISATTTYDRDTFSVSYSIDDLSPYGQAAGFYVFSENTNSAQLTWTHQINESSQASSYIQYGTFNSPSTAFGAGQEYTADISYTHTFSKTLTGSLQYAFTEYNSSNPAYKVPQNMIIVGLNKQF
jgi:uncharacterized protein (PEP-CTERM system associated)